MDFNPSRLTFVRKLRGFTMRSLAQKVGMTERALSQLENGHSQPRPATLTLIADHLKIPAAFFYADDIDCITADSASFRALTKMSIKNRDIALSQGSVAIQINKWFEEKFRLPDQQLPSELGYKEGRNSFDSPEGAAEALRCYWELAQLPIPNMFHLLESKGIRIFSLSDLATEIDAFSFWHDSVPYIMINAKKTSERHRFDLAHELGHLILHQHERLIGRDIEKEANGFASAFLMPRNELCMTFRRSLTIPAMLQQKQKWGVSLAALNYRLHVLGLSTDWIYRSICREIAVKIGRDKESDPIAHERSLLIEKIMIAFGNNNLKMESLSEGLRLPPEEISRYLFEMQPIKTRGHLKIIK
ncbi:MAG: ImmA/IrrE family metallo-endopeptidase [Desulfarculales bacterium]|jgi:Zn-dependent peptidase ImmA (M78 family)/DNA-binding XRE family transcriptional regulator|nr:ImmA/IrrE family metallo-endopeptidase [Desulfarculales bacterium]